MIIIGNGVAGIEAALTIRKNCPESEIRIFSKSKNLHYYRPKLVDYIGENITPEKLQIYKQEFYDSKNIINHLATEIVNINTVEKTIADDKGTIYQYDKLLLALGAESNIPEIDCQNKNLVFALRTLKDAENINKTAENSKTAVIAGGGLLGLECAYSLQKKNIKITVVEQMPYLLSRQFDESGAAFLEKLLRGKGMDFIFNNTVAKIIGNDKMQSAVLADGKEIQSDMIIVSAGVRANLLLAKNSSVLVNRGIIVDDSLMTNVKDVYAAGDCTEHRGRGYGLWTVSKEQGMFAGMNMCGIEKSYTGSVPSTALKITGIDAYSSGNFNTNEGDSYVSANDDYYIRVNIVDGKPVGASVINNLQAVNTVKKVMSGTLPFEDFSKQFNLIKLNR